MVGRIWIAGVRAVIAGGVLCAVCAPAHADVRVEQRSLQDVVDRYVAAADWTDDVSLVGGAGRAVDEPGFWIRGGGASLRIQLALQTRYEAWRWASGASGRDGLPPRGTAGDRSGFSVPRATLTLAGEAPCCVAYHVELEWGHVGEEARTRFTGGGVPNIGTLQSPQQFESLREAWVAWQPQDRFEIRAGLIQTPGPRQLMISPHHQQFVDVSLASAFMGAQMPGYTDRNRDLGVAFRAAFGAQQRLRALLTITNGDGGDGIRNVLDGRSSDNLAYALRLDWSVLRPMAWVEGATRQDHGGMYGELGGWVFYYEDRVDRPHTQVADSIRYGLDLAFGVGGFSLTGGVSVASTELAAGADDVNAIAALVQVGYLLPGTAWEVAARFSTYRVDNENPANPPLPGSQSPIADGTVQEWGVALNHYLKGHENKLTLDVSWISGSDASSQLLFDAYAGLPGVEGTAGTGDGTFGTLVRLQWQLVL